MGTRLQRVQTHCRCLSLILVRASRKKIVCTEKVYEIDLFCVFPEFTLSSALNKVGKFWKNSNFFEQSLDFLSIFNEEFRPSSSFEVTNDDQKTIVSCVLRFGIICTI